MQSPALGSFPLVLKHTCGESVTCDRRPRPELNKGTMECNLYSHASHRSADEAEIGLVVTQASCKIHF